MGIDLRRGNGAVSKQGLDISDIHSRLQKRRGKCMPKHVGRHMAGDVRFSEICRDDPADGLRGKGAVPAVVEDDAL